MKILVIGDAHGRVFHLVLLSALCQKRRLETYDLIIQVGDMGVWPDTTKMDQATHKFSALDSTELDFSHLVNLGKDEEAFLKKVSSHIKCPVRFIRGNHEDQDWLRNRTDGVIDRLGVFKYIPDGTILESKGFTIGFLGGITNPKSPADEIDEVSLKDFLSRSPGSIDLLVTHLGPYVSPFRTS